MQLTALSPTQIYAHLEAVVLPVLEQYQTDLTSSDRTTLADYKGPFLLSYRPTGTNLLVLGGAKEFLIADDPRPAREQVKLTFARKRSEVAWDYQKYYLHFDGAEFHELTREQALRLTDEELTRVLVELDTTRNR